MKHPYLENLVNRIKIMVQDNSVIAKWEDDYRKMQAMMYGESPSFGVIIEKITQLNERIRNNV